MPCTRVLRQSLQPHHLTATPPPLHLTAILSQPQPQYQLTPLAPITLSQPLMFTTPQNLSHRWLQDQDQLLAPPPLLQLLPLPPFTLALHLAPTTQWAPSQTPMPST